MVHRRVKLVVPGVSVAFVELPLRESKQVGAAKNYGGEITEGGIRQRIRETRKDNRIREGLRCITGWDRVTATTYVHLRTNKGNLQSWRYRIGKADSPMCRFCNLGEETGDHVVFECRHWEGWRVKRWINGALRTWES